MKKSFLILSFLFISIFFFFSCATPYSSDGFMGGFSETQLDENVFRVHFRGNGYTSNEKASDYSLLRCSEVCLQSGFSYFIITSSDEKSESSSYTTPSTSTTKTRVNVYGNSAYGNSKTTTQGGQTYYISKPSATNLIVCFKEKPEVDALVYNAKFILKSIKEKYNIQ